ncbi:hypothetical protein ERO13_D06G212201v2 [Gossypium hirsutum]|nr:hypothetical protein ERO13_D06G212201v2 [Gossypium hirsutum]
MPFLKTFKKKPKPKCFPSKWRTKGRVPLGFSSPVAAQPFRSPSAPIATRETGIRPSHYEGVVRGGGARARAEATVAAACAGSC